MQPGEYHRKIIQYYKDSENAYKDSWDLNNSLSIHYGYWDSKVKSFSQSLLRMNEVMMEAAAIKSTDRVLDAGCGVGGSSIFLAKKIGCKVTGITLSERQQQQAISNAKARYAETLLDFKVMDYCQTDFDDESFDVVWGCESICYAENKEDFIKEAYRLLKPGGRLVVADGFVTKFENNDNLTIRKWLDGWQVNYLETPERFESFMIQSGFKEIAYKNISKETFHSSRRLHRIYYLASLYLFWKKINLSKPATDMQKKNIKACRHQFKGMKLGLWQYGIITGRKL
jgi:tocopherol O-methyltransferase